MRNIEDHTHYAICVILSHYTKAQLQMGESIELKSGNSKLISSIGFRQTEAGNGRTQADHYSPQFLGLPRRSTTSLLLQS